MFTARYGLSPYLTHMSRPYRKSSVYCAVRTESLSNTHISSLQEEQFTARYALSPYLTHVSSLQEEQYIYCAVRTESLSNTHMPRPYRKCSAYCAVRTEPLSNAHMPRPYRAKHH
jgi:hypothetical protein